MQKFISKTRRLPAVGPGLACSTIACLCLVAFTPPVTYADTLQQAYLKASNTDEDDQFGETVAISGTTLIVGAVTESSGSTGINGDQSNNSQDAAGAVYVFEHNGTMWNQQAYLKASNAGADDLFGFAIAISNDTVVVGAPQEGSDATGTNGDQANNLASHSGAVYVFTRSGSTWTQQAYLKASESNVEQHFGSTVAISGDTLAVGGGGDIYVFTRTGSSWSQQAILSATDSSISDSFGEGQGLSLAISGDTIVVGARSENSNATGVDGNSADNSVDGAGAAYVFTRSGSTWTQQAYLKASNTGTGDQFGSSVSISENTIVIGAPGEASSASGVNGDQTDNSNGGTGAAYVFTQEGSTWSQQAYLKARHPEYGGNFGFSVSLSGDVLAIGAFFEDSDATGIDNEPSGNLAGDSGAVYTFSRTNSVWSQHAYIKASNADTDDAFGVSMGMSGDRLVVGATHESSNATGIDGDQANNSATFAGAAYVFNTPQGFEINPGLNGSWANFDTLGQGFFIDVLPDIPLIFFAWFTWETDQQAPAQFQNQLQQSGKSGSSLNAVVGDDNHRWLTAQGPFSGNTAQLDVTLTTGGLFDDPQEVTNSDQGTQGTITLTFDDCETGTVDYDFTAIGLSGSVPIQRLAEDNVEFCRSLNGE